MRKFRTCCIKCLSISKRQVSNKQMKRKKKPTTAKRNFNSPDSICYI